MMLFGTFFIGENGLVAYGGRTVTFGGYVFEASAFIISEGEYTLSAESTEPT